MKSYETRLGCHCGRYGAREVKQQDFFKIINWKRLEAGVEDPPFKPDVCLITLDSINLFLFNECILFYSLMLYMLKMCWI